eukprot:g47905.t1
MDSMSHSCARTASPRAVHGQRVPEQCTDSESRSNARTASPGAVCGQRVRSSVWTASPGAVHGQRVPEQCVDSKSRSCAWTASPGAVRGQRVPEQCTDSESQSSTRTASPGAMRGQRVPEQCADSESRSSTRTASPGALRGQRVLEQCAGSKSQVATDVGRQAGLSPWRWKLGGVPYAIWLWSIMPCTGKDLVVAANQSAILFWEIPLERFKRGLRGKIFMQTAERVWNELPEELLEVGLSMLCPETGTPSPASTPRGLRVAGMVKVEGPVISGEDITEEPVCGSPPPGTTLYPYEDGAPESWAKRTSFPCIALFTSSSRSQSTVPIFPCLPCPGQKCPTMQGGSGLPIFNWVHCGLFTMVPGILRYPSSGKYFRQ